jgi:7,8-dihydropterin-6-yl-methyl-4-(beta-D-ribofuranosyl)aminobenzene 5'-phosphate synthase
MRIVTLIENACMENSSLYERFGLSIYIETAGKKILFDSGPDEAFVHNASAVDIDISKVDALVLSHAHFDHTGGLAEFLKINKHATIYALNAIQGDYFSVQPTGSLKPIGIRNEIVQLNRSRFHFFEKSFKLFNSVHLFAVNNYNTFIPATNSLLMKKDYNGMIIDDFRHELVMSITENDVNTVFTGCAHSGILNMFFTVKEEMTRIPVKTLIGGFHLVNPATKSLGEKEDIVRQLATELDKLKVEKIYTGHCTGQQGFQLLKEILCNKIEPIYTGKEIEIN